MNEAIMDYEMEYKKALERARKIHDKTEFDYNKGMIEEIFPELAESEDARIRKEIVRFIRMEVEDEIVGNKWLAWLERQARKEQDPRYSIVEDLIAADDIFQMSVDESMVKKAEAMALDAIQKLEVSKLLGLGKQGGQKPYVISTNKELLSLAHEVIGWLEDHKQYAAKDDIQYIQDCIEKIRSIQFMNS